MSKKTTLKIARFRWNGSPKFGLFGTFLALGVECVVSATLSIEERIDTAGEGGNPSPVAHRSACMASRFIRV
jgi:hypothetical protein